MFYLLYHYTSTNKEVGIRRGCVSVEGAIYRHVTEVDDIDTIQMIFGFELRAGDRQVGQSELCDNTGCNNRRSGIIVVGVFLFLTNRSV